MHMSPESAVSYNFPTELTGIIPGCIRVGFPVGKGHMQGCRPWEGLFFPEIIVEHKPRLGVRTRIGLTGIAGFEGDPNLVPVFAFQDQPCSIFHQGVQHGKAYPG